MEFKRELISALFFNGPYYTNSLLEFIIKMVYKEHKDVTGASFDEETIIWEFGQEQDRKKVYFAAELFAREDGEKVEYILSAVLDMKTGNIESVDIDLN